METDFFNLKGELCIQIFDQEGVETFKQVVPNLVVTAGKVWVTNLMQSGTGTPMSYMAVGTGTNAAAVGDTTLQTETARVATTVAGGTASTNTLQFVGLFGAGVGTGALTEAGIFNANAAGTMLSRTVYTTVNKGASDTLQITWTITVG